MWKNKESGLPVDTHVGQLVRQRRIELGHSQQKLSAVTGVSYQQLQKYERGANRISSSMLWLLSNVLGVSPGYFFEGIRRSAGTGGQVHKQLAREVAAASDRETMELVKAYGGIADPSVRKGVRQMIGALAKIGKPEQQQRPYKRRANGG